MTPASGDHLTPATRHLLSERLKHFWDVADGPSTEEEREAAAALAFSVADLLGEGQPRD